MEDFQIIIIDPSGFLRGNLRESVLRALETKWNRFNSQYRFTVTYLPQRPSHPERFGPRDFPIYLLEGQTNDFGIVRNLMNVHRIPREITLPSGKRENVYDLAREGWGRDIKRHQSRGSARGGIGIPSGEGDQAYRKVGFIKADEVRDTFGGNPQQRFVTAISHEFSHMGNVYGHEMEGHGKKDLMDDRIQLGEDYTLSARDRNRFQTNLRRLGIIDRHLKSGITPALPQGQPQPGPALLTNLNLLNRHPWLGNATLRPLRPIPTARPIPNAQQKFHLTSGMQNPTLHSRRPSLPTPQLRQPTLMDTVRRSAQPPPQRTTPFHDTNVRRLTLQRSRLDSLIGRRPNLGHFKLTRPAPISGLKPSGPSPFSMSPMKLHTPRLGSSLPNLIRHHNPFFRR